MLNNSLWKRDGRGPSMERRKRADGGMECGVDDAGMNGTVTS